MDLRLTDAGRAAIADASNLVTFTKMALGDGHAVPGVDDSARTTLRNERAREAAGGAQAAPQIALRASFRGVAGAAVWEAREVGLIARVGAGQEFLAAYGAEGPADDAIAAVAPGMATVVVLAIEVLDAPAQLAFAAAPIAIQGVSSFAALTDTPQGLTAGAYYRANPAGTALLAATRAQVLSDLLSGLADGDFLRVTAGGDLEGLSAAELLQ